MTHLAEKPYFPPHVRDRLKRYDRRLDLLWNKEYGRFEIWKGLRGRASVEIRTDQDGGGGAVVSNALGFCLEGKITYFKVTPPPKAFRIMVCGRKLDEKMIFFRLWLSDTWRFKNADALEKSLAEEQRIHERNEDHKIESDFTDMAKDVESYALNKPFMSMTGKHTDSVRKLSEDRN